MLDREVRRRLESLSQLPTIPVVIADVLRAVENTDLSAAALATLIERDQTLTARVLAVANSPFYGFSRRISTIDLAVVVLGLNSLKEILMSLVIQRFFHKVRRDIFDTNAFWKYSVFSGACCRVLARRLGYRLVGEAFVAGLMHDIGILIIVEFFSKEFLNIRNIQYSSGYSLLDSERIILHSTHCDIGAWLAEKWNLPTQLCDAIRFHHTPFIEVLRSYEKEKNTELKKNPKLLTSEISNLKDETPVEQPLTTIVAMSEWFAHETGLKDWALERSKTSPLYMAGELLDEMRQHDVLNPESAIEALKQEILEEYRRAGLFIQ